MNEVIKEIPLSWGLPLGIKFGVSKQFILQLLILSSMLASAFAIVFVKAEHRQLFVDIEKMQSQRDHAHNVYGQLLLEEAALGSQARVQRIAREDLHYHLPTQKRIIVVGK